MGQKTVCLILIEFSPGRHIVNLLKKLLSQQEKVGRALVIVGGLAAFLGMFAALWIIGMDFVLGFGKEGILISRPLVGMWLALMGILGGVMSWRNSKVPGLFAFATGIGGFLTIPVYFTAGGILLVLGAVLMITSKPATGDD